MSTGGETRQGLNADHSPPSSAKVKNKQELYPFSPLAPAGRAPGQISVQNNFKIIIWYKLVRTD
jgi:hypothetical protein